MKSVPGEFGPPISAAVPCDQEKNPLLNSERKPWAERRRVRLSGGHHQDLSIEVLRRFGRRIDLSDLFASQNRMISFRRRHGHEKVGRRSSSKTRFFLSSEATMKRGVVRIWGFRSEVRKSKNARIDGCGMIDLECRLDLVRSELPHYVNVLYAAGYIQSLVKLVQHEIAELVALILLRLIFFGHPHIALCWLAETD